jgi:RsiW-degrading membrane proteinase PrsW (M82 family)
VLLFAALACVPPLALVLLGQNPSTHSLRDAAWVFAAYFAIAWLLLIGVIVRPAHVTRPLLVLVVIIALVTQVPLALAMETALHNSTTNLAGSILTVGLPEELAKAVPVVVVALLMRRRLLTPVDYLFLGAASGLAFGASEVVRYFTLGVASGSEAATVLSYIWRFVTDPISHACWAGLTGYFIGLALTGGYSWIRVGWLGLAMAALLHGLNDWTPINGHPAWVAVVLVSAVLFLGYGKAGPAAAAAPLAPAPRSMPGSAQAPPAPPVPAAGHQWHVRQATTATQPIPPGPPSSQPAGGRPGTANGGQPWWQVAGTAGGAAPAAPRPAPERTRPWWEQ